MNGSSPNEPETGRTLVIGSSGFIGRFITEACLESGQPTYVLVRSSSNSPSTKATTIKFLQDKGAIITYVLREYAIEIVISAVGGESILDQFTLVEAIKNVHTVKDRKRKVRREIEKCGIPYSYICCNSIASWPYHDNTHPADVLPPLDRFQIYGDGTVKAYFVAGSDIGKFTVMSINDDRTLNKTVHFQPPSNLLNMNEMASLWETKIGRMLPRVTIAGEDLLQRAQEMRIPQSVVALITHDIFINGCQINFSLDKPTDVEVCSLYPDATFHTTAECFDEFTKKIFGNAKAVSKPVTASNNDIFVTAGKPEALAITAICT
ncbi:Leucoanthocyanidin reductase [Hibiscus syriacus]|uniref:Leucoanthocyanidin reductase n=1 Tax=Hibiscus syriacus TaxID=106335 RepID=A0A6A2Y1K9_HIBSY|nr:Leucoanthocyanidin reductase [Hibiscus syriacus]